MEKLQMREVGLSICVSLFAYVFAPQAVPFKPGP